MAIGTVKLGLTPQQYQQPNVPDAAFGAGVGTALKTLAQSTDDYDNSLLALQGAAKAEERRKQNFDVNTSWTQLQGQMSREQLDAINSADPSGNGLTDSRMAQLKAQQTAFLERIPDPELRAQYTAETEAYIQNLTTATYSEEFKLRTKYESDTVGKTVSSLASDISIGVTSLEAAGAQLDELLATTRLSPVDRAALRESALLDLSAAQFSFGVQEVLKGRGTVREPDGTDVVAAGLTPWERGFLNATSAEESGGSYTVVYGGHEITDFSDHPRIFSPSPNGPSSAAGRYQITASTWDDLVATYGKGVLPDFSPESQDRAAILLARERFNRQLGPGEWDFDTILSRGTDEQILAVKKALEPTWAAFANMTDDKFLNIFRGGRGVSGGGTGTGTVPDVFTDPRYAALPYETKLELTSSAQSALTAMQKAQAEQQSQLADVLQTQLLAGKVSASDVQSRIDNNEFSPADALKLTKAINDEVLSGREAQRFAASADAGAILGNTAENQNAAYQYYQRSGVMEALQAGDANAANTVATGFARTGVLPKEVGEAISGLVNSSDPRQMQTGLDALSMMRNKNPDMFAFALPKELVELEGAWNTMRKYSPAGNPAEQLAAINEWRSPEARKLRESFAKDVEEQLLTITPESITAAFDEGLFDWEPNAPATAAVRGMLKQDFDSLYTRYYPMFQDQQATTEFVVEQLKHSWKQDSTGGTERLMYLPPSASASGYPAVQGSYDWVRQDILKYMGWPEDKEFSLVTDPQSEADIAQGKPASYLLAYEENGNWQLALDPEDNFAPQRFRPTVNQSTAEIARLAGRRDVLVAQMQAMVMGGGTISSAEGKAKYDALKQQMLETVAQIKELEGKE